MSKHTPLYNEHIAANGKMVDFAGWKLPLHYGSQLEEHHFVRKSVGMFDVSHMTIVDVLGVDAKSYLQRLLANDVGKLNEIGSAIYGCMLNELGGIKDDLITYCLGENNYRLILNAATKEKMIPWMHEQAQNFAVEIQERDELAMIAIQGPSAWETFKLLLIRHDTNTAALEMLKPFRSTKLNGWFVARTGYTGEDGLEVILPANEAKFLWEALKADGVMPCGLGARDTLRLEAGLNLYGSDMDEDITPLESNLLWTVAWDPKEREFIGRQALEKQKSEGVSKKLVGLILEERAILRPHQKVITVSGEGVITSGTFSPTLEKSIGFASLPVPLTSFAQVEIRNKKYKVKVVKPPFVKKGVAVEKPIKTATVTL